MKFGHLRRTPWNPTFKWVGTSLECANKINSYHEDYPKYVGVTKQVLDVLSRSTDPLTSQKITRNSFILDIHSRIFVDQPFRGKWRRVNAKVGLHRPPDYLDVPNLMDELQFLYTESTIEGLIEWYSDFETTHPFQGGNGRVGGIIVAIYAHNLHPDKGWLAPNQ